MYLHLGQDTVVKQADVIGVFDLDTATVAKRTREFLAKSDKNKRVESVSWELPRSFTVCAGKNGENERVYLSPLSPATLEKRAQSML